jgi:hypothetical protein
MPPALSVPIQADFGVPAQAGSEHQPQAGFTQQPNPLQYPQHSIKTKRVYIKKTVYKLYEVKTND